MNKRGWRIPRRRRTILSLLLVCSLLLGGGVLGAPPVGEPDRQVLEERITAMTAGRQFRLLEWELNALAAKATANLRYPSPHLADLDGSFQVEAYLRGLHELRALEAEIERAYAAPGTEEAGAADLARMEGQAASLWQSLEDQRPLVETIIERQVHRTAERLGLETAGIAWPPVLFRLSPPPLHLVVSPRQRIELIYSLDLKPDMTLAEREALEARIEAELGVSALVEDLGGYGTYPPLVQEEPSLEWIITTVAHEWTHNYLAFRPLGWKYDASPAMQTLNETTASLVGEELGAAVIAYYYPWATPPIPSWQRPPPAEVPDQAEPPAFDFTRFMRETRQEAERLLAEGKTAEAEQYMESRRQELLSHGYVIRKLNQAYFAFHGLYATGPGSVDPTGPKMEELRRRAPSLQAFVEIVAAFSTPADLDTALERPLAGAFDEAGGLW